MTRSRLSGPRFSGAELVGILLIVIGGVYLLRNAGVIDVDWSALWPLLIVIVGVFIVLGALPSGRSRGSAATTIPREGARGLELDLGVGAGVFHVGAGATELVEVVSDESEVRSRVDRRGDRTRVQLRQDVAWFPFSWHGRTRWDVRIAPDVSTDLSVNGGAGDFAIDMSGLRIRSAQVSLGAAQIRIVLPRPEGDVRVSVKSGASSITIQVPPGVEARVTTAGLMSVNGRNETPGFASATNRVLVDIAAGASSVRIA